MIEIRELSKSFGNREVLSGLTLDVGRGEIFGLIGPNGAGKTTTIRMLATLLAPTRGDASICGHSILRATREARSKLGYMPDLHGLYEGMTVEDYLRFFAAAYAVPDARLALVVEQILELVDLGPLRGARIGELSRGTQQRISLARVLVHDPEVLILDEPASGLDPRARIEIREILRVLQGMGKTIFISSHILPELEEVCTRVAILDRGRLVWSGRPADGLSQGERLPRVRVRPAGARRAEALEALQAHPRVTRAVLDGEDVLVTLAGREDTAALVARALLARDIDVVRLAEDRPSLEEVFLQVTGRETGGAGEGGGTEEKS